ncbi:MAG TPA: YtxH domain-containing protein [Streptosporangiaceae bacterium]|nr:YtxH domain-containing protein [Streptosporangiaceae bacterium]
MHRYRITFLGGLAAGFVLGTRAGRERYEQMTKLARTIAASPAAQQAAGALQAQAAGLLKSAGSTVTGRLQERVPRLAGGARNKIPGLRHRNGSTAHSETGGGPEASGNYPFATTSSRAERNGR